MYFVGVDGGGTNTRVCVLNDKKEILGIGKAGPSSIDTVTISETIKSIQVGLEQVFTEHQIKQPYISSIFVGLGGVLTDESKRHVKNHLKELEYFNQKSIIVVENDVYSALLGGLANRCGIALISGTGSVAFGKDENGNTHRAGGYGYQEGDLGSAYHLGKKALMCAVRAFDKRIQSTDFTNELLSALKMTTIENLMEAIMTLHHERTEVARLAPIVTKHANLGDSIAREICDEAVYELALCIKAVYHNISLKNKEIAIIGSLGNSDGYFRTELEKAILKIDPAFHIHQPLIEPVLGSAYEAYAIYYKNN